MVYSNILFLLFYCLARGTCLVTQEYNAEGLDELSVAPSDHIIIVGLLVSCLDWFTGMKESTGEVGLVKTSLVKPSSDTYKWVFNNTTVYPFNKTQFSCSNIECLKFLHLVQFCQPHSSTDIFLDGEEGTFFSLHADSIAEETIALLKKKSQNDTGHNYKLGETIELQLQTCMSHQLMQIFHLVVLYRMCWVCLVIKYKRVIGTNGWLRCLEVIP